MGRTNPQPQSPCQPVGCSDGVWTHSNAPASSVAGHCAKLCPSCESKLYLSGAAILHYPTMGSGVTHQSVGRLAPLPEAGWFATWKGSVKWKKKLLSQDWPQRRTRLQQNWLGHCLGRGSASVVHHYHITWAEALRLGMTHNLFRCLTIYRNTIYK